MEDSILKTIRGLLGPNEVYKHFDQDIILHINSALNYLDQLGIGPEDGFVVTGEKECWSDFLNDRKELQSAKQYVYLKVKTVFDPPSNAFVMDAMLKDIKELEWRLECMGSDLE